MKMESAMNTINPPIAAEVTTTGRFQNAERGLIG